MRLFRPIFVSFLIITFLSQGLHSKSLVDRPLRKSFSDLILIHCSDPEHRHPPMNLPESGEDIQSFVLVLKESAPALPDALWFINFPLSSDSYSLDFYSQGRDSDKHHPARAPPWFEV